MLPACKACLSCGDHCTVIGPSPATSQTKSGTTIWSAFFNAVPRHDIVHAVTLLTQQFLEQSGCTVLSVDFLSKSGHQGNPRGKTRTSFKRCWVEDMPCCPGILFTGIFTAAGTCIGNQISPVLSGPPVLMAEQTFLKSLLHFFFVFVSEVCRQPPDIGTVYYYLSEPTGSRLLSPFFLQRDTP